MAAPPASGTVSVDAEAQMYDATNAFLAVPDDPEPRLELTLNHDREEPYPLGEG